METQPIEVLESRPGHVRLRVPELVANPSRAQEVRTCLDIYPGVEKVRANFLTGSLSIDFNTIETAAVLECLEELFPMQGLSDQLALRRAVVPCDDDLEEGEERSHVPTREEVRARATRRRRATLGGAAATVCVAGLGSRLLRLR